MIISLIATRKFCFFFVLRRICEMSYPIVVETFSRLEQFSVYTCPVLFVLLSMLSLLCFWPLPNNFKILDYCYEIFLQFSPMLHFYVHILFLFWNYPVLFELLNYFIHCVLIFKSYNVWYSPLCSKFPPVTFLVTKV